MPQPKPYDNAQYYLSSDESRFATAKGVLEEFFALYTPASVIDLGCGLGHWLSVCQNQFSINDIHGYDGNSVDPELFKIPAACYTQTDLSKPINLPERAELAISIEVAEHIPQASTPTFVSNLTRASDVVLFSAAAPYQGGVEHCNEQPPAYWAELFAKEGYLCFDILRDRLWDKEEVLDIHRQNMLIFTKEELAHLFIQQDLHPTQNPQLKYHPLFVERHLKKSWQRRRNKELRKAKVKKLFGKMLGENSKESQ